MSDSGGGGGCFTTILIGLAIWGLIFGFTISGKHYGLTDCNEKDGLKIEVHTSAPAPSASAK